MIKSISELINYISAPGMGLEKLCGKYYGLYPARVIDNSDPENRGRVRAVCPAVNQTKKENISGSAWMVPCMNGLGIDPDTGQMTGIFHPPDEGMNIWVSFQFGDPEYPVYMGGWMTTKEKTDTFKSDDEEGLGAHKKGIRTKTGHFLRFNDDPEKLEITISRGDGKGQPTSQFFSFTKEGHTLITNKLGSYLYMNAEDKELSLANVDEDGKVLSQFMLGNDKISMVTKSGGAFGIDGKNIVLTGDNVVADCSKQFSANAGTVMLGKGAKEPVIRGNKFVMGYALIHQHTTTAPGAPTLVGPTPPPMLYNELSESVFIS